MTQRYHLGGKATLIEDPPPGNVDTAPVARPSSLSMEGTFMSVDHFISWSRYTTDLGHNFVLAHPGCNSQKSDYLAILCKVFCTVS